MRLSDWNSLFIGAIAAITLVIGVAERLGAQRTRQLERAIEHRKEISDLTYATWAALTEIRERIARLETAVAHHHPDDEDTVGSAPPTSC